MDNLRPSDPVLKSGGQPHCKLGGAGHLRASEEIHGALTLCTMLVLAPLFLKTKKSMLTCLLQIRVRRNVPVL